MLKKRVIAVVALLAVVMSAGVLTAQKRQVLLDRVVAVVGGSAILYSEVEEYAANLVQQRREQGYTSDRDPMNEGLEALMRQKLLYNQALIDSVEVYSDVNSFVEEQLQAMIAEAGSIAELEAREHMAVFNFRELLRQQILEQEYARSMQQTVVSDVSVSPGEVQQFFKDGEMELASGEVISRIRIPYENYDVTIFKEIKDADNKVTLPAGNYVLKVSSTDEAVPDVEWEYPVYGATKEFSITAGEMTVQGVRGLQSWVPRLRYRTRKDHCDYQDRLPFGIHIDIC